MSMAWQRVIFHVDMDQFFAAIAILDDPTLRGKPLLIGSDGPRSVVTTASYEARVFGCRSAMPMSQAKRLCPQAMIVPVPGERVRTMSQGVFAIFERFSPLIQPMSVDEAFLDMTGTDRLMGDPKEVATRLKQTILLETQLIASVGVAENKFLAKLASDWDKPDGLTLIEPGTAKERLASLPVGRLWGVGPSLERKLHSMGMKYVSDLQNSGLERLAQRLGDTGEHLYRLSIGQDHRPVVPDREAKSIGQEQTFSQDIEDPEQVRAILLGAVEQVAYRLRKQEKQARRVSIKVRFGDFQTITRSSTLDRPTDVTSELWEASYELFRHWQDREFQPVRLIGMTVEQLSEGSDQGELFVDTKREKKRTLDAAVDQIMNRFGKSALHRASSKPRLSRQRPPDDRVIEPDED